MAANVKIIPSGHEFFVEGTEIHPRRLRARRAQARLRLLQRQLRRLQGAGGQRRGVEDPRARLCPERAREADGLHPHLLQHRRDRRGARGRRGGQRRRPAALRRSAPGCARSSAWATDMLLLHVQTPRTQTLRFMAGQRAHLTLEDGASGELPIASCPCNGRNLQFFVRRRPGDALAESAFSGPARRIRWSRSRGPIGGFVLHEGSPTPRSSSPSDDGIAPIKSLLEHAVSIDTIEAFHLYWARHPGRRPPPGQVVPGDDGVAGQLPLYPACRGPARRVRSGAGP